MFLLLSLTSIVSFIVFKSFGFPKWDLAEFIGIQK